MFLATKVDGLPWWKRDRELEVDGQRSYVDVLGRSTGLERQALRAEQFIALACECLGVDLQDVASRRQDSATGRLRRLIASCGVWRRTMGPEGWPFGGGLEETLGRRKPVGRRSQPTPERGQGFRHRSQVSRSSDVNEGDRTDRRNPSRRARKLRKFLLTPFKTTRRGREGEGTAQTIRARSVVVISPEE